MRWGTARRSAAVVVSVATALTIAPIQSPVASAVSVPELTGPLQSVAVELAGASLLPELNQLVPGLATNPARLFGLHDVFAKLPHS